MELELQGWKVKVALVAVAVVVIAAPFVRATMSNKSRAEDWHRRAVVAEESVNGLTREATLDYMHRQYIPNNIVVAVAGAVDHAEIVDFFSDALGDWKQGSPSRWFPAIDGQTAPRARVQYKRTEQAHIEIAVHALSNQDPDRFAVDLISIILGEGMSSRLFMELREKRALCYDVHSYASHYLDTGAFAVYAGVDPKKTVEATGALLEQLALVRDSGVSDEELHKAKELSKGRLLLRMEDTRNVSGWIGGQEMLNGFVRTPDEVVELAGLRLDPAARRASAGDRDLQLWSTEFRLLQFFMTHPGRIFGRARLLDEVWGDHVFVEERTVDVHIRRLRQALAPSGHETLIETVRGVGYRLRTAPPPGVSAHSTVTDLARFRGVSTPVPRAKAA